MKNWIAVAVCMMCLALAAGCRPDNSGEDVTDPDSLLFLPPDSLGAGVWGDDIVSGQTERLAAHQAALNDVFFQYDSEELSQQMLQVLMANGGYMMSNTDFRVLLEGHCDERGTVAYNLALGERRAQAVLDYLANYGIPRSRLQAVSYGKERPFVSGTDEWAHSQNRRVHLRVLPE